MSEKTPQQRYVAAAHAVQSGVKTDMETDVNQQSQGASTPKHLRTGLNLVMADHGSLAKLLIDKGVITEDEYLSAIAEGIEREKARYEEILTERFGKPGDAGMSGSGTTPGQAAYEAFQATRWPDDPGVGWTHPAVGKARKGWEAAAQAAIATVDDWNHYHQVVIAERDDLREQLATTRERLQNLAAGMELSARTSNPSKKSEIEQGCAEAVRGRTLPIESFSRMTGDKSRRRSPVCNTCRKLWETYRITYEDWQHIAAQQGGVCAIAGCGTPIEFGTGTTGAHVDHDHGCTHRRARHSRYSCPDCVRGLLCSVCNAAIGYLERNPDRLRGWVDYLTERSSCLQ